MTPKDEVEQLMNNGVEVATKMLREDGEFYPFGVMKTAGGEIQPFGVVKTAGGEVQYIEASEGSENPSSGELIAFVRERVRQQAQAGNYVAIAMFYDVRIAPPGEKTKSPAVQVELEHRSGYCADVFFPYSRNKVGVVVFGETFANKREPTVFR